MRGTLSNKYPSDSVPRVVGLVRGSIVPSRPQWISHKRLVVASANSLQPRNYPRSLIPNQILYPNPKPSYLLPSKMSTPGLPQIWSLSVPLTGELPQAPKFDIWIANAPLLIRAVANDVAFQLNAIPSSETRLRNEGMAPLYSFLRKFIDTLKSSAREQGVTVPAFPDAPADWSEEASSDYKALATLLRPHVTEPLRAAIDRNFGLRDRDPKLHWASAPASRSVAADLFIPLIEKMDGVLVGSEWGPVKDMMTGDEFKWIAKVMGEELLRIRAQPGSGWNEEEAEEIAKGELMLAAGFIEAGT